jgi:hypothetical protein
MQFVSSVIDPALMVLVRSESEALRERLAGGGVAACLLRGESSVSARADHP